MSEVGDRLENLEISAAELSAIIRRPVELIEQWISGDVEPSAEDRVALRVLEDDHRATLAVERVRHMKTLPLRSTGDWQAAGIEPPYGGGRDGATGGQPQ